MKPRLLDLFCGAGGAAMGYSRAGFEVVGVDINPQPHYPFEFIQADAMTFPLDGFDAIHASPPCQAFTRLNAMWNSLEHRDLLTPTRSRLAAWAGAYVIENVPGAPIRGAMRLCGTQFGLGTADGRAELQRHRYFEAHPALPWLIQPCSHDRQRRVIGVYGGHGRDRRRAANGQDFPTSDRRDAMGIDWMTGNELSQAIPPAYTEWIGAQLIASLERAA